MRWHQLVIQFALNLKYLSSSAYRAIRQSGVISLPSKHALSDYTHWTSPHTGVQLEFIEEFYSLLAEQVPCGLCHCALSMDEMKLKSGLVFNNIRAPFVALLPWAMQNHDINLAVNREWKNHLKGSWLIRCLSSRQRLFSSYHCQYWWPLLQLKSQR